MSSIRFQGPICILRKDPRESLLLRIYGCKYQMFGGWSTCTLVVRSPPTAATIAAEEKHTASRGPFWKKIWLEIEHLVTFDADSFSHKNRGFIISFDILRSAEDTAMQSSCQNSMHNKEVNKNDIGKFSFLAWIIFAFLD
jgi:hypothetical protein